jgi:hypothetical protein
LWWESDLVLEDKRLKVERPSLLSQDKSQVPHLIGRQFAVLLLLSELDSTTRFLSTFPEFARLGREHTPIVGDEQGLEILPPPGRIQGQRPVSVATFTNDTL